MRGTIAFGNSIWLLGSVMLSNLVKFQISSAQNRNQIVITRIVVMMDFFSMQRHD